MKASTRKQLELRKAQAVRLVRNVLGDNKAGNIEDESLEDNAEHRHVKLTNQKGTTHMEGPTRKELVERIEELETENEDLQSQLDQIRDLVSDDDGEEDTDTAGGEDNDQGED